MRNGRYQVIDYKTGVVEKKDLKTKETGLLFEDPELRYPFQLLVYAWALANSGKIRPENIEAGIFSLRKPSNGIIQLDLTGGLSEASLREFEEELRKLIEEIFDTSVPFTQVEDPDRCKWCPYKEICNRL
jgi:CRISPR/Cas system-associated exonuclease Cas4 (RecB family)